MRGALEIWHLIKRVLQRASAHRLADESAKIAYFSFLSLFPLILILFALAGMLGGEAAFEWVMEKLGSLMPGEAAEYLGRFVQDVTGVSRPDVLSVSLLFLVISASNTVVALISGLNLSFGIDEGRPWWRRNLLAMGATLGGAIVLLVGVSWLLGGPEFLQRLGFGWLWSRFHGPISFAAIALFVWLLYIFLPNHTRTPGRLHLAAGAIVSTVLWVGVTQGLRFYLASFERFASLYGFVTGILVLLIWLYLSAFTVLFGGEVAATLQARSVAAGHD